MNRITIPDDALSFAVIQSLMTALVLQTRLSMALVTHMAEVDRSFLGTPELVILKDEIQDNISAGEPFVQEWANRPWVGNRTQ